MTGGGASGGSTDDFFRKLPVARQHFFAEPYDLLLDFLLGQEALIALPDEPFRIDVFHHRVHLAADIVAVAGIGEFHPLQALDRDFLGRQHHFAAGVALLVGRFAPCFRKAEVMKYFGERDTGHPAPGKLAGALLVFGHIDAVQYADSFAQFQLAARRARLFTIGFDESAHHGGMGNQDGRNDLLARAPSHRLLADRKGLEQGRMRPLIGLGHHVDLLDTAQFVHLAGKAVLARPLMRQPRRALLRMGKFVVLPLEAERFVAPRQLEELINLLEGFAIDAVGFALVAAGRGDVNQLRHLVEPSRLIPARETDEGAAPGQLIEPRDFQRQPQRVPSRQHVSNRTDLDALGVIDHMLGQHRQAAHLDPFAVQVMFGEADRVEAHVLRDLRQFDDFIDHLLPFFRMVCDRAQLFAFFQSRGQGGQEKVHELHWNLLQKSPVRRTLPRFPLKRKCRLDHARRQRRIDNVRARVCARFALTEPRSDLMHDLVIRNGKIVDGSGQPAFNGDIAIDAGKITSAGGKAGPARREIDASGLLVTPGWVDIHTHYDGQVSWDPYLSPSSWHGVTTVVMGNCGVGFAPVRPGEQQFLIELMEGVEDIPGETLAKGMSWNWHSFGDYLDALSSMKRAIDVGAQVAHGAVRAYVMGERGAHNEPATEEDIARMAAIVREAMRAGAVGFSTSRTLGHRAKNGEVVPGTYAAEDELFGLGRALGQAGHGVFEMASDLTGPDRSMDWMARLSKETGRPVSFIPVHLARNNMIDGRELLAEIRRLNREGAHLVPQVAARPPSLLMSLRGTAHPLIMHPTYRSMDNLPFAEKLARLRDPQVKARILAEGAELKLGPNAEMLTRRFDNFFQLGDPPDYEPAAEMSIAARARREGKTPEELTYDILLERDGTEFIYAPITMPL